MSVINSVLHAMSDHGNVFFSKFVTYAGVSAGIGGGGVLGIVNGTASKVVESQGLGIQDWAAVVAIVSGLCLAIKSLVDTYLNVKADRRIEEQERQQRLVDIANAYMDEDKRKEDRRK